MNTQVWYLKYLLKVKIQITELLSCECAPSAVSNCVNVTDTCISDTNGNWRKVTKICGSDKNTCEVSDECSPEECVGNEHKNCYKKFDCKYENGYDCDQKSKEFYDAVGNVIQTKTQNCCTDLDNCTKDQVMLILLKSYVSDINSFRIS